MGRGKPIILETKIFDTQSQAMAFFKEMLNRYIPGERVADSDSMHLASFFKRHPEFQIKQGTGVSHFEVRPGDYGSQCFCVVRMDGTKERFSYKRCVTQRLD